MAGNVLVMDTLPISTVTTHYVNFGDLERFVKAQYGHDIEIAAMEEVGNDTSLTFDVNDRVSEYYANDLVGWVMDGRFLSFGTHLILTQLCADGHIPAGKYVIRISW